LKIVFGLAETAVSFGIFNVLTFARRYGVNGMATAHGMVPYVNLIVAAVDYFV
jgi:hypothetical protein